MTFRDKVDNGKKLLHDGKKILVERIHEKKHILSEKEIADLPMAKVLNSTIELLSENELRRVNVVFKKTLDRLYRDGYKYLISIEAGAEAVFKFDDRLLVKLEYYDVKKIGGKSYWHYFVRCKRSRVDKLRAFAFNLA